MSPAGTATARLARVGVALLVLLALVAALVVGLVALAGRWSAPGPELLQPACTADVASTDTEGARLRARFAPDQTANAALVVGVAHRRGLPARAATIGIATAVQESGLRNIDYGDRDSLGLFQQRPSQGWGSEEQVQDPLYSTGAFYDALVRIDGYTDLEITDAAQRVQRSGFPEAYADHEGEGRALASSLYGLSPASLTCDLRPLPDDLAAEAADPGSGLTPRAAGLLADLEAFGPAGWQLAAATTLAADGAAGPLLVELDAAGAADPARTAWSLAHTVVALADSRAVTRVEVDGRVWDRDRPGEGWADAGSPSASGDAEASEEPESTGTQSVPAPAGAGTVRVTVG